MYGRTYVATSAVLSAGRALLAAEADPVTRALAADRLAGAAESSFALLDDVVVRGFDDGVPGRGRAETADELLEAALGQLGVANLLFVASRTVGEDDEREPGVLGPAVGDLKDTVDVLGREEQPRPQAFETSRGLSTVEELTASFVTQAGVTLDSIVKRSTETITSAVTGVRAGGPQLIRDVWTTVSERLQLDQIGGRLARIALRALSHALRLMAKVFPSARLIALRAEVDRLVGELDDGPAGQLVVGLMLGTTGHRDRIEQATGRTDLRADGLKRGIRELERVTAGHSKSLELWSGIAQAIGIARTAVLAFRVVVPHLEMVVLGAHLVVIGAVITHGRDSVGHAGAIIATTVG